MMTKSSYRFFALVLLGSTWVGCGGPDGGESPKPVSFAAQIKPLLQEKCISCHNTETLVGKLNLENRDLAFVESPRGKFIVPGKPDESLLYTITLSPHGKRALPEGVEKPMPLQAPNLSAEEKDLLRRWIAEGADWPKGADGHIKLIPDPES